MNQVNPIDTGISQVKPIEATAPQTKPNILSKIYDKIPPKINELLKKFYSNKKIFWPVTITFGIMFLIIILGLLFGSTAPQQTIIPPKKTPPPFVLTTPEASASGDILTVTENQLRDLNNQINSLDLGQNKLKPPVINYNISF